jgi:hypothetical protein
VSTRRRLGVVPRDESLIPDQDALGAINSWADSKDEETAELIGRHAIEHAPFGLDSREMDAIFEDVVAEIGKFHEVGALSDLEGISRPAAQ